MSRREEPRDRVDVRIPPNDMLRLRELSSITGLSVSNLVRTGVVMLLSEVYDEQGYIKYEVAQAIFKRRNKP